MPKKKTEKRPPAARKKKTVRKRKPRSRVALNPRPRHKWAAADWIAAFQNHRSVTHACAAVGIAIGTAYERRNTDVEFARAWDEAAYFHDHELEASAMNRAIDGIPEPVIREVATVKKVDDDGVETKASKYSEVAQITKYDNALTFKMLARRMPEKYSERVLAVGPGGHGELVTPIEIRAAVQLGGLPRRMRDRARALLADAAAVEPPALES